MLFYIVWATPESGPAPGDNPNGIVLHHDKPFSPTPEQLVWLNNHTDIHFGGMQWEERLKEIRNP